MSLNKVMLIGKAGGDPEIRDANGSKVATFSIATTEHFKDRNGEDKEQTEWHRIIAWRHLAEFAENHIKKGTQIFIEGKLRTRKWSDRQGIERYTTEIYADSLQVLGRRQDGNNPNGGGGYDNSSF